MAIAGLPTRFCACGCACICESLPRAYRGAVEVALLEPKTSSRNYRFNMDLLLRWVAEGSMFLRLDGLLRSDDRDRRSSRSGPTMPTARSCPTMDAYPMRDYGRFPIATMGASEWKKPSPYRSFSSIVHGGGMPGAWPISLPRFPEPTLNWKAHPSFIVQIQLWPIGLPSLAWVAPIIFCRTLSPCSSLIGTSR